MFNQKLMFIPLEEAERKLTENNRRKDDIIEELRTEHTHFVNDLKATSTFEGGIYGFTCYPIGTPTGIQLNGLDVYAGDELRITSPFLRGTLGFVAVTESDGVMFFSNSFKCHVCNENDPLLKAFIPFKVHDYEISTHFIQYQIGQEIAKGRRGGRGFIVEEKR